VSSPALSLEATTIRIAEEIEVRASIETTFAALLDQLGPCNETGVDRPMPMKLEAWPGGRWYGDLGDDNGHYWGMVQAIKKPTATGNLRATVHVQPGDDESSVSAEGIGRGDADQLSTPVVWTGAGGIRKRKERLGIHARAYAAAGGSGAATLRDQSNLKIMGANYVSSMHRKRGRDGGGGGIDGRNSGDVHRQIQKIFQGQWSRSVSENQGEIKWQQARRKTWST